MMLTLNQTFVLHRYVCGAPRLNVGVFGLICQVEDEYLRTQAQA